VSKFREQWKEASMKDRIEIIGISIGIIAAICGTGIGILALREYKAINELTMIGQLQSVDREISMMIFNHPTMNAIWVVVPDTLHGKDRADALLKAFLICEKDKTQISGSAWKTVRDLESILWSQDNIHNEGMRTLRKGYNSLESTLYLVCTAITARQRGQLRAEDEKTFVAYLNDIGAHPLFLHALWFGHKGGYFSAEVARCLQKKLLKNRETREMADSIYKELLDEDWPEKVGNSN
jgi:hypothetical protein